MLDFTRKSAQIFNLQWKDLVGRKGDHWKIDIEMFGRVPMLLIVHEQTLFTIVRRKSEFRNPNMVADEIRLCCNWYRQTGETGFGRNSDRRLSGSINEMKRITRIMDFSPEGINKAEMAINGCLFTYLGSKGGGTMCTPFEAVNGYQKGEMPWLR